MTTADLSDAVVALRGWQRDDAALQLHPGDLGWAWRLGQHALADSVRLWRRGGDVVAVGLLDGPDVLRLAVAPDLQADHALAGRLADDLGAVLTTPSAVEVPTGAVLRAVLRSRGWTDGEAWAPLQRDLTSPVPHPGVRTEVVTPATAAIRVALQRAAFDASTFDLAQWHAMAAGAPYEHARCLLAFDGDDVAVAAVTVWSAGAGRPGLIEPLGTHRDHRHRGHGRAVSLAAAAHLRELGASSAQVCTPAANEPAVVTYRSAGFVDLAVRRDLARPR